MFILARQQVQIVTACLPQNKHFQPKAFCVIVFVLANISFDSDNTC